jgi:hypothetical protein
MALISGLLVTTALTSAARADCGHDGNGSVTATDALIVLKAAVLHQRLVLECDDHNGDRAATVVDALALLRFALGVPGAEVACDCYYRDVCRDNADCAAYGWPPQYHCASTLCVGCESDEDCEAPPSCSPLRYECEPDDGSPLSCESVTGYPGDQAAEEATAAWMGERVVAHGVPAQLPVMGALVESGLQNLPEGGMDSAGFFQMRVSIWNQGDYAGFPDAPELQVEWFVDQALAVKAAKVAAGDASYGEDPAEWGEWIADVERPPAQFRGRYQLRLDEARELVKHGCPRK